MIGIRLLLQHKGAQLLLLSATWLVVQTALYLNYGINPVLESLKYIHAAKALLATGQLPEARYYFYLATTLLIAAVLKAGGGYGLVIFVQLLINGFATYCFYIALYRMQRNPFAALICTLVLICFIPYQTWNFYLYTESLFYSFILLFFSSCIQTRHLSTRSIFIQAALLLLVVVSRPLGILFLPCWIVFLILHVQKKCRPYLAVAAIGSFIFFVIASNFILGNIGDWKILTSAENNEIICDVPVGVSLNLTALKGQSPLMQLYAYITNYPSHFFTLMVQRLSAFLLLTRTYYTVFHNGVLLFLAGILYVPLLFMLGIFKKLIFKKALLFSFCIIGFFCLTVALQCDDYHNRFHHAIVPVFLFSGVYVFVNHVDYFLAALKKR